MADVESSFSVPLESVALRSNRVVISGGYTFAAVTTSYNYTYYQKTSSTDSSFIPDGDYVREGITEVMTNYYSFLKTSEAGIKARTFTITGGDDAENPAFITWLVANAIKQ